MKSLITIATRLQYVRNRWNLTPSQLATRAGVSVSTVRRLERGDTVPTRETARRLADALHIRVDWLMTGDSGVMVLPAHMTTAEQPRMHTGPGSEGLPGYVVIDPGGLWYRDKHGVWRVDRQL